MPTLTPPLRAIALLIAIPLGSLQYTHPTSSTGEAPHSTVRVCGLPCGIVVVAANQHSSGGCVDQHALEWVVLHGVWMWDLNPPKIRPHTTPKAGFEPTAALCQPGWR